jgi:secernin
MCDTMCVLPEGGSVLFAKNSDRSPNEPHIVLRVPPKRREPGGTVKLTYIEIPEAEETLEAVLCKPSWIWGAEMGVNAAGVAIGNEAVFTRNSKAALKKPALTGMDLLRLALERADCAEKAVEVITSLLERYGQGGNCGYDHQFYYDNSFLIADPDKAFILETSGRRWAAKRVSRSGAISNRLSIRTEHTLRGGVGEGFDFAGKLTEPLYTFFSGSKQRQARSLCALTGANIGVKELIAALRSHQRDVEVFTRGSVKSVCMHAGGLIGDHTTGSLVAELRKGSPPALWVTGASTPCLAAFKPYFFGVHTDAPVFWEESASGAKRYWYVREKLHRAVLAGMVDIGAFRREKDELESGWIEKARALSENAPDETALLAFASAASADEQALISRFIPEAEISMPGKGRFARYWRKKNEALFGSADA